MRRHRHTARRALATVVLFAASAFASAPATASTTRGDVAFDVVARGTAPAGGNAPRTRAEIVRSRPAAEKLLARWDLDRAVPKLKSIDFKRHRLLIVVARGNDTTVKLDVNRVSASDTRLTATGKLVRKKGAIGNQVISTPYALVTVPKSVNATSARLTL